MEANSDITLIIIGSIIVFLLAVWITRAIFGIPTIVKNTKAQTTILIAIAKKNGVTNEEINSILNANGVYGADIGFRGYE
jgi:hypothetical protein